MNNKFSDRVEKVMDGPASAFPQVLCKCCQGTGKRDLEPLFTTTVGHTAINNRLVQLHRLGLAKRVRKEGKQWVWKATSGA